MKIFYSNLLLILFTYFSANAQTAKTNPENPFPTVFTLTQWASYNSQAKFDIEVRGLGFKFEGKETDNVSTGYTYIRKVTVNNIAYTDRIVYRITKDNSASVISLVTASTDLVSFYSPQLISFKSINCTTEMAKDPKTTCTCYESKDFNIDVCDERVKLSMGDGNKYFISVAKK